MKKISMILILVALTATAFSQTKPFSGFFRPVDKQMFCSPLDTRAVISTWLIRPAVTITAMQINFGETTTVQSLTSLGTGLSYSRFLEQNGEVYQNFSANLLILFGTEIADVSPLELSIASSVSLWQYLSFGCGWNFMDKKFFLLSGVIINFNK